MSETSAVEFTEDRIPAEGIGESADELVELFGGEMQAVRESARDFVLPLRRGVAVAFGFASVILFLVASSRAVAAFDVVIPK